MLRFAFDMGTNSIGWAVIDANQDDSEAKILDMGVRIFGDGRQPGRKGEPGDPLNQTRRMKRAQRRQLERRKRRKQAMYRFLKSSEYLPLDKDDYEKWRLLDPYQLRAEAIDRELNRYELSRVMMNLSTRRGFKSNRKTDAKSKDVSIYKDKIKAFAIELGDKTLGQYLYEKRQTDPNALIRFRPGTQFYPDRSMYEKEFQAIRDKQSIYHPAFDWDRAYRIIFFQRPIRRPQRGNCTFYPDEARAFFVQPSTQLFKALQDINNLSYLTDREHMLEPSQKETILEAIRVKKKLSFSQIRNMLNLPNDAVFNLEKGTKDVLEGLATDIEFSKKLGSRWKELNLETRDNLVELFIVEDDDQKIKEGFAQYGFSEQTIHEAINTIDLRAGVSSLSTRFMRDCIELMQSKWIRYDEAVTQLGLRHYRPFEQDELLEKLPYYGKVLPYMTFSSRPINRSNIENQDETKNDEEKYGRISNPTVHIALNQLRKLCNILLDLFGKPEQIIVETATDLKNSRKKIAQINAKQRENREKNTRIRGEIASIIKCSPDEIGSSDILKYQLWEELGNNSASRNCIYCGNPISAHQLFNGEVEIEHILPFSRTLKNNRNNLTVAHRWCNNIKGDRTPYEAFGSSPNGYTWAEIEARVSDLFRSNFQKRANFLKEDLEQNLSEESSFLESQLSDTAFITRAVKQYLSSIIVNSNIITTPGQLTSILRSKWGLNGILSQYDDKNRCDHRHHAIDALVISLTTRRMLQRFASANARNYAYKIMPPPFPVDRQDLKERLLAMLISYKPDHGLEGPLFDESAYGYNLNEKPPQEFFIRKPLASLTWKIIQDEDVLSKSIRKKISEFLQEQGLSKANSDDKALQRAMLVFMDQNHLHPRSVKIRAKNAEGYMLLEPGKNGRTGHKAYPKKDVLCVDIWQIPVGNKKYKFVGDFKKRADVHSMGGIIEKNRPHPAAKFLMRLYKNDIIRIQNGQIYTYALVAGLPASNKKLDLRPIYASSDIKSWLQYTRKEFCGSFWRPIETTQNFESINKLFGTQGNNISHVNITIDGKLSCRKI